MTTATLAEHAATANADDAPALDPLAAILAARDAFLAQQAIFHDRENEDSSPTAAFYDAAEEFVFAFRDNICEESIPHRMLPAIPAALNLAEWLAGRPDHRIIPTGGFLNSMDDMLRFIQCAVDHLEGKERRRPERIQDLIAVGNSAGTPITIDQLHLMTGIDCSVLRLEREKPGSQTFPEPEQYPVVLRREREAEEENRKCLEQFNDMRIAVKNLRRSRRENARGK